MLFHRGRLIDHVHLRARDFDQTRKFYEAVGAVLGITIDHSGDGWLALDELFIDRADADTVPTRVHLAFQAPDRETVQAFHEADMLVEPVLETGLPTLLVLNMADELAQRGGSVDEVALAEQLADVASRFDAPDLLRMLALASELDTEGRFRKSANPRTMLEVLLLRFAYLDRTIAVEELLRAAGGTPPPERVPRASSESPGADASSAPRRAERGGQETAQAERRPERPAAPLRPAVEPAPVAQAPRSQQAPSDALEKPAAPATAAPRSANAAAALRALQRDGSRIPHGLGIFLKVARVEEQGHDRVALSLPPGPGLERLSGDSRDARALEQAFGEALGRPIELVVRPSTAAEGAAPRRLTPEQVRADRLARIAREQPMLARAVEQWDLELIDE